MLPSELTMASERASDSSGQGDLEKSRVWMDPADIKFTQDSCSRFFTRRILKRSKADDSSRATGSYSEALKASPVLSLEKTLQQLINGDLKVEDFPPIRVVEHDGVVYSLDNRRLWVFKEFKQLIPVISDESSKEFFRKLTRSGTGDTIRLVDSREKETKNGGQETLESIVLPWSVDDIMNDRMYVNKVALINLTFTDLRAYYSAFRWPFLEQTRGQVQKSLVSVGSAPYIELICVEEMKVSSETTGHVKKLKLTTRSGKTMVQRNEASRWKPKPRDLVILSTIIPECLEDLQRSGEHYALGLITSGESRTDTRKDENDDYPVFFTVNAYFPSESPEYKKLFKGEKSWHAISLDSLVTSVRIWEAIHPDLGETCVEDSYGQDPSIIKVKRELVLETLYGSPPEPLTCEIPNEADDCLEEVIERYCTFRNLNNPQTEAIRSTIMGFLKQEGYRVRLIQGPPGTGKTTTVTTLLSILSCFESRIIVCAPTNRAISEVAERFLLILRHSLKTMSQFSDFASSVLSERSSCRPLQLGDVVMIGNEDRIETNGILGQIFLPLRKDRLLQALNPFGWRHSSQLLATFLQGEDAILEYDGYVENCQKNPQEESSVLTFLQFTVERLTVLVGKMIEYGNVMCSDLPSKVLDTNARQLIDASCTISETLLTSLKKTDLSEKAVRKCFHAFTKSDGLNDGEISLALNEFCSAREKLLQLLSSNPGHVLQIPYSPVCSAEWIETFLMKYSCLVFSTVSSAGRWCVMQSGAFEYAVIDEAAQLVEAETAIVTQLKGIKHALLVGDPKQLQALVTSQIAKDSEYGRSLFERLQTLGHPCQILNVQYRMRPEISKFPSERFYGGILIDGENVVKESYKKSCQSLYGPYAFIDVKDGEEVRDETTSWKNPVEIEVVHHLISTIRADVIDNAQTLSVGVIAPYKSQVTSLTRRLLPTGSVGKAAGPFHIDVKTVDGFQGGEKDVIVFSAVRANAAGHVGFVNDPRRLNVALTRGRYCVWVIGNASTLARDEMWGELIQDAKRRKCYMDARNDSGLKKVILRAKKDLEQFASLLDHNSLLFHNTMWKVEFSKEFKDTITQMKSTHERQIIIHTLLRLAEGQRSPYPTKCNHASEAYARMIHVQSTAGLNLVWTVDVDKSDDPVKQVIRIWNAVDGSFLQGLIRRLEAGFSTYSAGYLERCSTLKLDSKMKKYVIPIFWKVDSSFVWHKVSQVVRETALSRGGEDAKVSGAQHLERSTVDESILLMKFYSLTSGIARQLLTTSDGSKMELMFQVNEEEASIIRYPSTTFILGRSGTGKTTVITTKLLREEQNFKLAVSGFFNGQLDQIGRNDIGATESASMETQKKSLSPSTDQLRQAMVTLSPRLCSAIKNHIAKVSRTMLAENHHSAEGENNNDQEEVMLDEEEELKLMGAIPDTLVNISPDVFPLVITFRKFLAMLDGSVLCPFLAREKNIFDINPINDHDSCDESASSCSDRQEAQQPGRRKLENNDGEKDPNEDSVGKDDDEVIDSDEDMYSDTSSLDYDLVDDNENPQVAGQLTGDYGIKQKIEVTFERFLYFYWPHFNQVLTKEFDSSVIFTEIISFIKGSLEALQTSNGRLTRKQYASMAEKRTSTFDEQQRQTIYSIYELYEKQKLKKREYDIADYCMHLYHQLKLGNYRGVKFHFVYVDEVQDLTIAQISLFKYVSLNIKEGFVFAGDTAQTIARGISFRFQDIRHLFYTEFLEKGSCSIRSDNRRTYDEKIESTRMPDLHHLSQNFRTHVGIVNIANSVVELLHHFFPNAVDKLSPESSLILGDPPVFLETEATHESVTSLFGHGGAAGGGGCDFGAEQVILVRSAETKQAMIHKLGKRGLVMSVLDCKGLEFQSVLLYNFFSDSLFENKWRVIYSYMAENAILEQNGKHVSFPRFGLRKHNLLMSELKQLYVVITRARQRLWIYDEIADRHKPMLDFWNHSGLIQVKQLDDDLIKTLHGKSSPEDWKRRGIQMFNDRHYDMAQLSFERAGEADLAIWATAAGLQQSGERLQGSDPHAAAQLFKDAAQKYITIQKYESAAKCYQKVGDNKAAGHIWRDFCKPPRLDEAGNCFMDAKCWEDAARAYGESFSYRQCLAACTRGKLFDKGTQFLDFWKQQRQMRIPSNTTGLTKIENPEDELESAKVDYLKKCALYYHKIKDVDTMMKYVRLFPSISSQKQYLGRREYFDQLIEVEQEDGNFNRAAEMADKKGDLMLAAKLLQQAGRSVEAVEKLLERARFEMLWSSGKHGWPLIASGESEAILQSAKNIAESCFDNIHSDIVQEVELLLVPTYGLDNWTTLKDTTSFRVLYIAGRLVMDTYVSKSAKGMYVSFADLLSVWDLWSKQLMALLDSISRARRRRDSTEDQEVIECSNAYLSVEKKTQPNSFVIIASQMSWLHNCQVTPLPNQGQRCQVDSGLLFTRAEAFWVKQLCQVGLEVVKVFECFLLTNSECCTESLSKEEALPKVFNITNTLLEILNRNGVQDGQLEFRQRLTRYGSMIYEHSFPPFVNDEMLDGILDFREMVGTIYDNIATDLLIGNLGSHNHGSAPDVGNTQSESWGRIQILLPHLSKHWVRKYGSSEPQGMKGKDEWLRMWKCSHCIFSQMLEDSESSKNTCQRWLRQIADYWIFLKQIYSTSTVSAGPFLFTEMLERVLVMDLACHRHLHNFILPEIWVVRHMTGANNRDVFCRILNAKCTRNCQSYSTVRSVSRFILDLLNSSSYQIEAWFDKFGVDWRVELPTLIVRFVVAVLTACINSPDRQMWDTTVKTLSTILSNGSPLMTGLPLGFVKELKKVFMSQKTPQDDQIRIAFRRAMSAIRTPLVVLKHGGCEIEKWAYKSGIKSIVITRGSKFHRRFDTSDFHRKRTSDVKLVSSDLQRKEVKGSNVVGTEQVDHTLQSDKKLLEASVPKMDGEFLAATGDLAVEEDTEDADEGKDDPSFHLEMIPKGHVSIGDGQFLRVNIKARLLQLLEDARQRLKVELSPTESYRRECQSCFKRMKMKSKEYLQIFLLEACPLKETIDDWFERLESSLRILKDGSINSEDNDESLLDDIEESREKLFKEIDFLDPRNKFHETEDLSTLQSKVGKLKFLLASSKKELGNRIRKLGHECNHEGENSSKLETPEKVSAKEAHGSRQGKKKKPQKKKKKGRK